MTAPALVITNAQLPDGSTTSVRLADGVVHSIGANAQAGDTVLDAGGRLLLPAVAEAHAHLDKAFLADTVPNPGGDLMGAIVAIDAARDRITEDDIATRAERAARLMLANGATAIRTHADVNVPNGLKSVRALLAVRERLRDIVHLEVFAFCGWPIVGPDSGPQLDLAHEALTMGVDGLGGCPHLESDPAAANEVFIALATQAGLPLDLHTDETIDPAKFALEDLADRVTGSGFPHRVTASHCVSLGMQPGDVQERVAGKLAAAGINVIALPSSNLFLNCREQQTAMPRGLTAVRALLAAGVNVAAGADNLQDPFNPVGRGDCLETAALMVMAAHLLPDQAFASVSSAVRNLMGLPPAGIRPGDIADMMLVGAGSVREAIAFGPTPRTVIRGGVIVAG